jgi:hypothetical protein
MAPRMQTRSPRRPTNAKAASSCLKSLLDNLPEMRAAAEHYTSAALKKYQPVQAYTAIFAGIHRIDPSPAIRQVTWSVGSGPPTTTVSVNTEHTVWEPGYEELRKNERIAAFLTREFTFGVLGHSRPGKSQETQRLNPMKLPALQEQPAYNEAIRWLPVKSAVGEVAPSGALLRVTGAEDNGTLIVNKPNADNQQYLLICGPMGLDANGRGVATYDEFVPAAFEDGDGTPAVGEAWGSKSGEWLLRKTYTGFVISAADNGSGQVEVSRAGSAFEMGNTSAEATGSTATIATYKLEAVKPLRARGPADARTVALIPPTEEDAGYDTLNVVTNVCPIKKWLSIELSGDPLVATPVLSDTETPGSSVEVVTGITVEKTPLAIIPDSAGTKVCTEDPDDCCTAEVTCCPDNPVPWSLTITEVGGGSFPFEYDPLIGVGAWCAHPLVGGSAGTIPLADCGGGVAQIILNPSCTITANLDGTICYAWDVSEPVITCNPFSMTFDMTFDPESSENCPCEGETRSFIITE